MKTIQIIYLWYINFIKFNKTNNKIMNISKIFSNSLQKNINVNKNILDMINPSKANENRKFSVFQRIRKKSLKSISNKEWKNNI